MVVVPEPAVKCGAAFAARAVDGPVCPAVDQRADEAFRFAVGLWPVGASAAVADAESAAGERVQGRLVGGAVVGQNALDADPVAVVEGDCAAKEADRRDGFLVGEDLGVGEAAVVVDADVHALEADRVAADTVTVGVARIVSRPALASEGAFAGTGFDPAEPLDVDVDELARSRALVADRPLEPETAESAQTGPSQDPRDRRERHPQRLRDLGCRETQPAQLHDRLYTIIRRAVSNPCRRRRVIEQTALALQPIPTNPLPSTTHADPGGLRRRGQRRSLDHNLFAEPAPAAPTERRVSVKLHPVPPWAELP